MQLCKFNILRKVKRTFRDEAFLLLCLFGFEDFKTLKYFISCSCHQLIIKNPSTLNLKDFLNFWDLKIWEKMCMSSKAATSFSSYVYLNAWVCLSSNLPRCLLFLRIFKMFIEPISQIIYVNYNVIFTDSTQVSICLLSGWWLPSSF